MDNPIPDLNDLIREAYDAQEAFDNWDEGETFYSTGFGKNEPVVRTLAEVSREMDEANRKLVEYVLANGEELLLELAKEENEDGR